MRDNEILKIIIPFLRTQLASFVTDNGYDMPPPLVLQNFQPTQQGAPTPPSVFIHKVGDYRYGSPLKEAKWDTLGQKMIHTETEIMENTYQVSSLMYQNPVLTDQSTASDLVNAAAIILQSDICINAFQQYKMGILRVTTVRNSYFVDDKERQESYPSFDFTVTHKSTTIQTIPIVDTFKSGIHGI